MKSYKHKYGVTLVEILIVVAIIALLATMVIGIAGRIDNQSKERGLKSTFALLEIALQEYYEYWDHFPVSNDSNYPTPSAALYGQLHSTPSSRKILEEISDSLIDQEHRIYDLWGMELDYSYVPGNNFPVITSAGPDKFFGTADDISSR